jgi:hypothetical protein
MRRIMLLATVALVMAAMMVAMVAPSFAAEAQGEPIGSCPPDFHLFTVAFVHEHVGDPNGVQSWDPNGDGFTCVKFIANDAQGGPPGEGQRVSIVDNSRPL